MSDTINRGRKAAKRIVRNTNQEDTIVGLLGEKPVDPVIAVTGLPGWVYVRIRQSNGATTWPPCRNDAGVPHTPNLPVLLEREYYLSGNYVYVITGVSRRPGVAYAHPPSPSGIPPHLHDDRYYRENEHIATSTGAADASKPAKLDAGGKWDASLIDSEDIADIIGAMVAGNTETDIAVTYQGADNTLDFVLNPTLVAERIHAATLDTTPLDADEVPTLDSSASFGLLRTTWTSIKAFLKTYFDTLYDLTATAISALATKTTPVDADALVLTDSAAGDAPKRTTWANIKANLLAAFATSGTYTPAITGIVSNPTITYSDQSGKYVELFGLITFYTARIVISTISGGSGEIRISLPTTLPSGAVNSITSSFRASLLNVTGTPINLVAVPLAGTATAAIQSNNDNAASVNEPISALQAGCGLIATGFYFNV